MTVAQVQAYGFTQSVALIEEAINAASQGIENYCNTIIKEQTDIREWVSGNGANGLYLRNIPVTTVAYVGYGYRDSLRITHTETADLRATVEVTDTELKLKRINSVGGSAVYTADFTDVSDNYLSATLLAANVNSSATGWSATVVENALCADFHRLSAVDCQNTSVTLTTPETNASIRHVDETHGVLYLKAGKHACGSYNYLVQYNAGYSTIPTDIQKACLDIVSSMLNNTAQDEALQSESLGDYSYTRASTTDMVSGYITGNAAALLSFYRRRGF